MSPSSYLLIALACAGLWGNTLGDSTARERSRIVKEILEQDHLSRPDGPPGNLSAPVEVTLTFTPMTITDLDLSKGVLELTAYLGLYWKDSRLAAAFDSSCDESLASVQVPLDSHHGIWTPDIELYNIAAPGVQHLNRKDHAIVAKTGDVTWIPSVALTSPCVIDRSSPFNCTLKFGSWTHNGLQLALNVKGPEVDISNFIPSNPRWALHGTPTIKLDVKTYDCCPEPYYIVEVTIPIRRQGSGGRRARARAGH